MHNDPTTSAAALAQADAIDAVAAGLLREAVRLRALADRIDATPPPSTRGSATSVAWAP